MIEQTCMNCANCEFRPEYLYPFRCKKNKTKSYSGMQAMIEDNGERDLLGMPRCKNFVMIIRARGNGKR